MDKRKNIRHDATAYGVNMSPILWILAMAMCVGANNVIVERKLAQIETLPLLVFNYVVLLSMSFPILIGKNAASGTQATFPPGHLYLWIFGWAAVVLMGDFCYFRAYHSGGSVGQVTTLLPALIPVFAIGIKAAIGGGLPSVWQLLAIPCAALTLYLATRT